MPSKFDLLREGKAVEIEPGVSGRLNKEKKKLELSTGEVLDVSNDPDFYPKDERSLAVSREKEQIQRGIGENPLGEFGYQFSQKGLLGSGKDIIDFATQGDNYINRKMAQQQVSEKISEQSPWTSRAATAASFIPDVLATKGMSALRAAPLLTAASSGSKLFTNPGEVLTESAIAAAGGHFLDKTVGGLSKIAQRRGASRAIPEQQAAVRAQNLAGEAETAAANRQAKEAFQRESQFVERENSARMHQHNLEVNARKEEMLRAQQTYEQAKASHASNVNALKEEAKNASKVYEESVRKIPELQREAQKEFSQGLEGTFQEIEKSFPKGTQIPTDELNVWGFYNDYIQKNGLVGSAEARQNQQLFRSLFPNGKNLSPKEFGHRLRSIEAAIGKSSPESQKLLGAFKEYLSTKAPPILGEAIIARGTTPRIVSAIDGEIASMMKGDPFSGVLVNSKALGADVRTSMNDYVKSMTPTELQGKIKSGQFSKDIKEKIFPYEKYESFWNHAENLEGMKKSGMYDYLKKSPEYMHADKAYEAFVNNLAQRAENAAARTQLTGTKEAATAKANLTKKLRKTQGMAEPIQSPMAPEAPIFPEAPIAPNDIPMPQKPIMMGEPSPPIAQSFSAQPEPTLAPAQNMSERAGDFLEKPLLKGTGSTNNLLKLGALKYALGPAALPLEAAALGGYGASKLLTSPGAVGEAARLSFKQAGVQAIEQMARRYPSYNNGVLENPQERRSLTKEIEDDQEIPLEQKAILQSKVNRGKPLSQPLQ